MNEKTTVQCAKCGNDLVEDYVTAGGRHYCNTACRNVHEAITGFTRAPASEEDARQMTLFNVRRYVQIPT